MNNKPKIIFQNPKIQDLKASLLLGHREEEKQIKVSKELKYLVLGTDKVGKSSMINKFLYESLPEYFPSMPEESYHKIYKHKNDNIDLRIIDMAGLDDYTPLTTKYSVKVNGYIFVYAIDDLQSFEFVQRLRGRLFQINGRHYPCLLVGNKSDLKEQREVSVEEGKRVAKMWGVPFLEVSILKHSNEIINKVFETIIKETLRDDNDEISVKCWKNLPEKKLEGLFELFNFANLLSLIVGLFFIAFGSINLILYDSMFLDKREFLISLTLTGIALIIFSIFGFVGLRKENKRCIMWFAVLGAASLLGEIVCISIQLAIGTNPPPVQTPNSTQASSPSDNDDDDGLVEFKPVLLIILGLSALILMFLIFMAVKSRDIFILKRKLRSNKYSSIKV
jgi:small GTP-binding protein